MYEDIPTPDYLKGYAGYTVILIANPAPQVRRTRSREVTQPTGGEIAGSIAPPLVLPYALHGF